MSVDILGTSCDQCRSMVQYSFTSTWPRTATSTLTQLLNYEKQERHFYLFIENTPPPSEIKQNQQQPEPYHHHNHHHHHNQQNPTWNLNIQCTLKLKSGCWVFPDSSCPDTPTPAKRPFTHTVEFSKMLHALHRDL